MMKKFIEKYLTKKLYKVADVGSYDVNGTFKPLLEQWDYTGLDIEDGPNVDVVIEPYYFGEEQYDVVVSGNCMEHVEDLVQWADAIKDIVKPNGLLCITTPFKINEHRHPVDCWRVMPDGMRFLFRDMEIIECGKEGIDTYLIAKHGN